MAVDVSGEPKCMTSAFLTQLTFSRIEFINWVSRINTISFRPRLTNSDFDGYRKIPLSVNMHEHLFMSSYTDLGYPAIVELSKSQTLKLLLMEEAMS